MFMRAKIENRLTKSVSEDEKHEFEVHLTWTNAIHIFLLPHISTLFLFLLWTSAAQPDIIPEHVKIIALV